MTIQHLYGLIKSGTSCKPENLKTRKDEEGNPYIFLDGFEIKSNGFEMFTLSDTAENAIPSFKTSGENIYQFIKGVYDAYLEPFDSEKSNEFYDKGFQFTLDTAGEPDFDNDEEDSEPDEEEFDEEEHTDTEESEEEDDEPEDEDDPNEQDEE